MSKKQEEQDKEQEQKKQEKQEEQEGSVADSLALSAFYGIKAGIDSHFCQKRKSRPGHGRQIDCQQGHPGEDIGKRWLRGVSSGLWGKASQVAQSSRQGTFGQGRGGGEFFPFSGNPVSWRKYGRRGENVSL